MSGRLIIEGNAVYELDETCMNQRENRPKGQKRKNEDYKINQQVKRETRDK